MDAIIFKSFAKINLFLHVLGKRADGYHDLDGIMTGVSVYDTIRIEKANNFSLTCDMYSLANENNLAIRAAKMFFEKAGISGGAHIFINKHIPPMSGLGGGSGNAGTTLLALNDMFMSPLNHEELNEIALSLGADVPFFIHSHACRAQGIGEKLSNAANNLDVHYLILKPHGGVDTKKCFELFDAEHKTCKNGDITAEAIEWGDIKAYIKNAQNMLTKYAIALCPKINDALEFLALNGAMYCQMTGSGSAVFGMFDNRMDALLAYRAAKDMFEFKCIAKKVNRLYKPVLRIKRGEEIGLLKQAGKEN